MESKVKIFLKLWDYRLTSYSIPFYLHFLCHHELDLINRFGSLSVWSGQGFENPHQDHNVVCKRRFSKFGGRVNLIKSIQLWHYSMMELTSHLLKYIHNQGLASKIDIRYKSAILNWIYNFEEKIKEYKECNKILIQLNRH